MMLPSCAANLNHLPKKKSGNEINVFFFTRRSSKTLDGWELGRHDKIYIPRSVEASFGFDVPKFDVDISCKVL